MKWEWGGAISRHLSRSQKDYAIINIKTTLWRYHLLFRIDITFNYDFITTTWNVCVFYINMHFPWNGCHFEFGSQFWSYINVYKIETFLMLDRTFSHNLIYLLQVIALCRSLKRFFSIKSILEITANATLKRKIRERNIPGIMCTYTSRQRLPTMLPAFNKMFRCSHIFEMGS